MVIKDRVFLGVSSHQPVFKLYLLEDATTTLKPIINLNLTLPYPMQWDLHIGSDNKRLISLDKALLTLSDKEL